MKLLLFILLILSSNCFGQNDTAIYSHEKLRTTGKMDTTDWISVPPTDTLGSDLHFDTVNVMMFYADTTNYPIRISDTLILSHNSMIQWQYGYEVQILHNGWPETYNP